MGWYCLDFFLQLKAHLINASSSFVHLGPYCLLLRGQSRKSAHFDLEEVSAYFEASVFFWWRSRSLPQNPRSDFQHALWWIKLARGLLQEIVSSKELFLAHNTHYKTLRWNIGINSIVAQVISALPYDVSAQVFRPRPNICKSTSSCQTHFLPNSFPAKMHPLRTGEKKLPGLSRDLPIVNLHKTRKTQSYQLVHIHKICKQDFALSSPPRRI